MNFKEQAENGCNNNRRKTITFSDLLKIIELILILIGLAGAYFAYGTYTKQNALAERDNKINTLSMLRETDREISSMFLQYPVMDALWAEIDGETDAKKISDAKIKAILKYTSRFNDNNTSPPEILWSHVSDLVNVMWGSEKFENPYYLDLRRVYTLAEKILYLVTEAIELESEGLLTAEDSDTYLAYLRTLGSHPLFLHAVWFGKKDGYFKQTTAKRIQEELVRDELMRKQIEMVYPELVKDDKWHIRK